jgi:hypothetical protein
MLREPGQSPQALCTGVRGEPRGSMELPQDVNDMPQKLPIFNRLRAHAQTFPDSCRVLH